jgi:hypothetical protein
LSQKVGATPLSREKQAMPFGSRCGSGDEASPARSATGASQLHDLLFSFSTASFRLGISRIAANPIPARNSCELAEFTPCIRVHPAFAGLRRGKPW